MRRAVAGEATTEEPVETEGEETANDAIQLSQERYAELSAAGIEKQTVNGLRVTSPEALAIVRRVFQQSNLRLVEALQQNGALVAGQAIRDLVTVNGVRVTVSDGSWGLVRASSNKPELVVVVESPVSEQRMRDMFEAMDSVLRTHPEVGAYNQKI